MGLLLSPTVLPEQCHLGIGDVYQYSAFIVSMAHGCWHNGHAVKLLLGVILGILGAQNHSGGGRAVNCRLVGTECQAGQL